MNIRRAIAVLVGIAFAAVPVGVAWADTNDYPPNSPTVALLLNSAPCDANVSVSGDHWQSGSTIDLTLNSPNNAGSGSGVSQQTPAGKGAANQPATQVEGTTQTRPSGVLPFTGAAAVGLLLVIGLCLILTGSTSVLAARRRVRGT